MSPNHGTLPDRESLRALFDTRSALAHSGIDFEDDPAPLWHRLRETGPVHEGTVHELMGYTKSAMFHGVPDPDRPHYSVFSHAGCDAAYHDEATFASSPDAVEAGLDAVGYESSR